MIDVDDVVSGDVLIDGARSITLPSLPHALVCGALAEVVRGVVGCVALLPCYVRTTYGGEVSGCEA